MYYVYVLYIRIVHLTISRTVMPRVTRSVSACRNMETCTHSIPYLLPGLFLPKLS